MIASKFDAFWHQTSLWTNVACETASKELSTKAHHIKGKFVVAKQVLITATATVIAAILAGVIPWYLSQEVPRSPDVIWAEGYSITFPVTDLIGNSSGVSGSFTIETTNTLRVLMLRNVGTAPATETRILINRAPDRIQVHPPIEFAIEQRSDDAATIVLYGLEAAESVHLELISEFGIWANRVTFDSKAAERVSAPRLERREYRPDGLLIPYFLLPLILPILILLCLLGFRFRKPML